MIKNGFPDAITDDELVPNYIMDFFTWLGYFNRFA